MPTASQQFVTIREIRDGIAILKGGGLRAVLMTSSVNLALKSEEEQQAAMLQFQNFLNTLEFSVQILVQSRKLNIQPYLETLQERQRQQEEELLRVQTREYIEFIRLFTEQVNVMSKTFYVVVPYDSAPIETNRTGFLSSLRGRSKKSGTDTPLGIREEFELQRSQIEQRMSVVEQGISRLGMNVSRLTTEELIELYHGVHNPGDTSRVLKTVS